MNYRTGDFVAEAKRATGGEGVDVVLDSIGAAYFEKNLAALRTGGRLVLIGLMGGAKTEVNLALLLARRLSVIGSTLRTRSLAEKAAIVARLPGPLRRAISRPATCGRWSTACSRWRAPPTRTGCWRPASTSARSC